MTEYNREGQRRALAACEAHRDAISVVARDRLDAPAIDRLRGLGVGVTLDDRGGYVASTLDRSSTCNQMYAHAAVRVRLPSPCGEPAPPDAEPSR